MMISANAEWKVVVAQVPGAAVHDTPYGQWLRRGSDGVVLFHGGYGKVAAAGSTQFAIDRWHPRLIINVGTCGGVGGGVKGGGGPLAPQTGASAMGGAKRKLGGGSPQYPTHPHH